MGISERKEKQKAELKQLILEASVKLFSEHGYDGFSMRKIAEMIEYSPTTVYLYFKDKNEILFDLHEIGFRKFEEPNRDLLTIKNPLLRLHKMGENYIKFGLENPEYYDLMFLLPAPMEFIDQVNNIEWNGGDRALTALKGLIQECIDKKLIKEGDINAIAMGIWGMVHGLVSLKIRYRCDKLIKEEDIIPTMYQSLNWMINILEVN
jgi:AcrR family transcriptional regulator